MPLSNDALLRVLLRMETADHVRQQDLEGPPLAACESRLFTLMEQEGVQPMFAAHLRTTWERRFEEAGDEGVPGSELREGLRALRVEPGRGESEAGFSERATLRLVACVGSIALVDRFGDDAVERKALETGPLFRSWPAEILKQTRWNTIESVFPGVPDLPVSEAWVHLRLRKLRTRNFGLQAARIDAAADFAEADPVPLYLDEELEDTLVGEPLLDVLHAIRNLTCVLGQPGAGKSTLIKWLARHIATDAGQFFTLPLFVNLREYALQLEQTPALTLFDFFLRQRGLRDTDQMERWAGLRERLRERGTPEARDFFFWLLDGWDEVPDRLKERVLSEIRTIAEEPGIITSRHSAHPLALPCGSFWEIAVLPRHAQRELAANWLRGTGSRVSAEQLMERIRRLRGCDRLARNPMLLTLLCGLLSERGGARGTLRSRGDIYRETIHRVADHHTRKHPGDPFDTDRLAQTRTLAARLFTDAEAPAYGFTAGDVAEVCHDPGFFHAVLRPSRLVCCPSPESSLFQFHHASFQEYLTAEWLVFHPAERTRLSGRKLIMDAGWTEVARFAATLPEVSGHLWESLRGLLGNSDRYGVMLARAAGLLASAGARDGGRRLLGRDVREELWAILMRHRHDHPWMITDALMELDSRWFMRRMAVELNRHPDENENTVLPFAKHLLLMDEEFRDNQPAEPLPARMQEALARLDFQAYQSAFENVPDDESGWELREEAIRHMHEFGAAAVPFLKALLTSETCDEVVRGMTAGELADCDAPEAGRTLMRLLAGCEPGDNLVWHVLSALDGSQLSPTETGLVSRLLAESPSAEVREEAAAVLGKSRLPGTAAFLLEIAAAESEPAVLGQIWASLLELSDPAALSDMWKYAHALLESSTDPHGTIPLLLAAGVTASKTPFDPESRSILDGLTTLTVEWLNSDKPTVAAAAANLAVLLGDDVTGPVVKILGDHTRDARVRIEAARTLGELRVVESVPVLRAVFDFPDCGYEGEVDSLHTVAAQALGKIAPEGLLGLSSQQAERERARLAFTANVLFFEESFDQPVSSLRSRKSSHRFTPVVPSIVIYGNVEHSIFVQGDNTGMATAGDSNTLYQRHEQPPTIH